MSTGTDKAAGRLRAYFDALPSVKVGVVTDGIVFDFYVDAATPDVMDDEPFFTLDCETLAREPAPDEVIEPLLAFTRLHFDPAVAAEAAHVLLVKKRLRKVFVEEAKAPSDGLCRFALERAGLKNVRRASIERYYAPMVKAALEESLVLPVVEQLRAAGHGAGSSLDTGSRLIDGRLARTDRELDSGGLHPPPPRLPRRYRSPVQGCRRRTGERLRRPSCVLRLAGAQGSPVRLHRRG